VDVEMEIAKHLSLKNTMVVVVLDTVVRLKL